MFTARKKKKRIVVSLSCLQYTTSVHPTSLQVFVLYDQFCFSLSLSSRESLIKPIRSIHTIGSSTIFKLNKSPRHSGRSLKKTSIDSDPQGSDTFLQQQKRCISVYTHSYICVGEYKGTYTYMKIRSTKYKGLFLENWFLNQNQT